MALPNRHINNPGPITADVLQKTVSKIGVEILEHLVQDYTATLTGAKQDMETVLAMDGELEMNTFAEVLIIYSMRFPSHC